MITAQSWLEGESSLLPVNGKWLRFTRFLPLIHPFTHPVLPKDTGKITFHCAFKQRHTQRHIVVYTSCDRLQPGSCTASVLFIHVMFKKLFQAVFFLETKKNVFLQKVSCSGRAVCFVLLYRSFSIN